MAKHLETGQKGEDIAVSFLEGTLCWQILARNFTFQKGEADIIALDTERNEVVFVEVKTRSSVKFGYPEASVSKRKQELLFILADEFQHQHQLTHLPARFDVVAIDLSFPEQPQIYHIFDAFREDRSVY